MHPLAHLLQLGEGETIVRVVHRHWLRLALVGVFDLALLVATLLALGAFDTIAFSLAAPYAILDNLVPLSLFSLALLTLVLWTHFFLVWTDIWLDVWVITTSRVVAVEQQGLFVRRIASFPFTKVQDVTSRVHGALATWLDVGDVELHSASDETLVLQDVAAPHLLKEELVAAMAAAASRGALRE